MNPPCMAMLLAFYFNGYCKGDFMTIQQLNYFVETCRHSSITEAAKHLYISPAGLRLALHRIEQEFNCKLLTWGSKGVTPTEEGHFLLDHARKICGLYNSCEEHLGAKAQEETTVNVAISSYIQNHYIASILADFNRAKCKYQVIYKDYSNAQAAVDEGKAQIGFDSGFIDKKSIYARRS